MAEQDIQKYLREEGLVIPSRHPRIEKELEKSMGADAYEDYCATAEGVMRGQHLLFLAVDVSAFSGFRYRSRLFNEHLLLPDSDDEELQIPSNVDPEEFLSVSQIIAKINLPGLELRGYEDRGGMACGPVEGGDITFGFVPQKANQ